MRSTSERTRSRSLLNISPQKNEKFALDDNLCKIGESIDEISQKCLQT